MPTRICASVWTTKRASSSLKAGDVSVTPRKSRHCKWWLPPGLSRCNRPRARAMHTHKSGSETFVLVTAFQQLL